MAEVALGVSIVALVVAIAALGMASSSARAVSGPRPNELSSLGHFGGVSAGGLPSATGEASAEVLELLAAGQKIEAIKQYRTETGAGLKEAKDAVEAFEAGQR